MPKVLCLCGYTQSAAIFRNRLSAIRKSVGSSTSFEFVDPPHIVQSVNLPDGSLISYDSTASGDSTNPEEIPRAWFYAKDVEGKPGEKRYEGMDETWALFKRILEAEQYDAVLGFSQGAGMAGALASLLARPDSFINHPPFKLGILVSGFALFDPQSKFFPPNGQKSQANTLHIIGRNDTIVSEDRSQSLIDKFADPKVEMHDGGHYVPSKANFRHFFRALFDSLDRDDDSWRDVQVPTIASGTSTPIHDGKL